MAFLDSLDIANRALFHLGAVRISSITEDTKNCTTMTFLYDKLRRAELRRNVWTFATRRAVIRPATMTTMLLVPQQWNGGVLYLPGSIVQDANGVNWISTLAENVNNTPGQSAAWDQYFGPMTADIFSNVSNYTAWSNTRSYNVGDQVSYNGVAYQSLQAGNVGNIPSTPSSAYWFSITVAGQQGYYAGELVYVPSGNPGGFVVFMSLVNSNTDVPTVATAWDPTVQYTIDQAVSYGGMQWRSIINYNINNTPVQPPALWLVTTSYAPGNQVTAPDGFIYTAVSANVGVNPVTDSGSNWTNTKVPAAWSSVPTIYPADINWLPLYAGLQNYTFIYPTGCGPSNQSETRNVYRLPSGYLRQAPQDPKAGSLSFLGAPAGLQYTDWEFENNFLISRDAQPIVFRFVADVTLVSTFDDMFCEGLAARIAYEACEDITQSLGKQQTCAAAYKQFMFEARAVNAIETGATEPPEDDYITCRV